MKLSKLGGHDSGDFGELGQHFRDMVKILSVELRIPISWLRCILQASRCLMGWKTEGTVPVEYTLVDYLIRLSERRRDQVEAYSGFFSFSFSVERGGV